MDMSLPFVPVEYRVQGDAGSWFEICAQSVG